VSAEDVRDAEARLVGQASSLALDRFAKRIADLVADTLRAELRVPDELTAKLAELEAQIARLKQQQADLAGSLARGFESV